MAKSKKAPSNTRKFPADSPEARDEGPRLIPLDEHPLIPKEVKDANARYVALADQMLGTGKRKPRP